MNTKPRKILLIEDDASLADLYRTSLESVGYEVRVKYSGERVIDEAIKYEPDLILLDVMLPGMNGISVLRELKRNKDTKGRLVYMLSVLEQEAVSKQALELGADGYWVKSHTTPGSLVTKIQEVLGA